MKPEDVLSDVPKAAAQIKIPDIVTAFVKGKNTIQVVDFEKLGKRRDNTYASIRSYLERNPDIKVTMRMQGGQIVLEKIDVT